MRIAIFSDIHGNSIALDAVLRELKKLGSFDEYWILGDLVALGPKPIEVLERLSDLPNAKFVRGNTDRYVFAGDRPPPSLQEAAADASKLTALVECAATFSWTLGAITQAGWLSWLSELPLEIQVTLPDGTRVLGVHSAPGHDDGFGIKIGLSENELALVLGDCEADLIIGGHHHRMLDMTVNGRRAINVGSVSNPQPPDLRASYVVLEADQAGYQVEFKRVDYDREGVIDQVTQQRHPAGNWIIKHFRRQHTPFGSDWVQEQLRYLRTNANID